MSTFLEKLHAAAQANRSWLCVGLDPDPALAPPEVVQRHPDTWVVHFARGIIEATRDLVCCYKPNFAFYEALGPDGFRLLRQTLEAMPRDIPLLADAKRADIGNTSRHYARAIFGELGFDAVTVNPYLGGDSLAPFFEYPDRGVFVLCKTSNPGGGELQDLPVQEAPGEAALPLYRLVARRAQRWDRHATLGLVVGATYPAELAAVRADAPRVPILIPGVGAQAGDLEAAVQAGVDAQGERALVNASRGVLYASAGHDWQVAARGAAQALRAQIEAARAPREARV